MTAAPAQLRNKSSNLANSNLPKLLGHIGKYRHYSEIPKFFLPTGKHQKSAEKVNKI